MTAAQSQGVIGITGGTSGIGLTTALHFAKAGWRVAICGRDSNRLAQARLQLHDHGSNDQSLLARSIDVRDDRALAEFVDSVATKFGRVDAWVNNAGIAPMAPLPELTQADLAATWEINCRAIFTATQSLWPYFRRQRQGVIVNISSMSSVDPFPGFSLYGASKAWVNLFTKAVAAEGAEFGARAYAVCPGAVDTPLLRRLFPDFPRSDTLAPSQVAKLIAELVNPDCPREAGEAVFITSQQCEDD